MAQFWAILKDSFREAVDGFVIYVMLGLSVVMIVLLGSVSFEPAPADKAFTKIVHNFSTVFPDRGRSPVVTHSFGASFAAEGVQAVPGGYKLVVVASTGTFASDGFREAVAAWAKPPGRTQKIEVQGKSVEVGEQANTTKAERDAVTDADMTEFIAAQFATHGGMTATATRLPDGAAAPAPKGKDGSAGAYRFAVETTGGSSVRGWPNRIGLFFGAVHIPEEVSQGLVLYIIQDKIVNGMGAAVALLVAVVITAFFVPNMLRKGSVDLLVSKPISRPALLVYKYIGGLTFMFLVSAFAIGGSWLVLAARSGNWDPRFLVVIPVLTFTFALLYAVSVLVAVYTRSAIVSILLAVGFAFVLYLVGQTKTVFDGFRAMPERYDLPGWSFTLVDTLNNVLPRYKDLDKLTTKMLADANLTPSEMKVMGLDAVQYPTWTGTFTVTLGFIAVMLGLACWRFSRRDY